MHPPLVERLKAWIELRRSATDREILFPVSEATCGIDRRTSKILQFDLAAARRAWLNESGSDESSDFLLYKDSDGKFTDFHALRHTFIMNLCKADVLPKTAQMLARHCDISLTMNI